jgi:hypothetical protein
MTSAHLLTRYFIPRIVLILLGYLVVTLGVVAIGDGRLPVPGTALVRLRPEPVPVSAIRGPSTIAGANQ